MNFQVNLCDFSLGKSMIVLRYKRDKSTFFNGNFCREDSLNLISYCTDEEVGRVLVVIRC